MATRTRKIRKMPPPRATLSLLSRIQAICPRERPSVGPAPASTASGMAASASAPASGGSVNSRLLPRSNVARKPSRRIDFEHVVTAAIRRFLYARKAADSHRPDWHTYVPQSSSSSISTRDERGMLQPCESRSLPVRDTEETLRAARLRQWLGAKDPGFVAIKRAARVTLAACVALYFSLYVLHDTQMATFAAFGCIALGALSEVTGTPRQRTKTYAGALLAGIVLVTIGTILAVNPWAAVAGGLGIGFMIAYAGGGGPRVVGAANGLQLLYILPSFPPYAPEALGSRLIGLVLAVALLAIADRLIWPPPVPTPFRCRLAVAIQTVRHRLVALLESAGDRRAG